MRCQTHKREEQGPCNWCGKKLCEMCIAQQNGRKYYCEHCAVNLVPYKAEKRPAFSSPTPAQPRGLPQITPVQTVPVKRKFVMGKDGYFELH